MGVDEAKMPRLEFQCLPTAAANIQKKFFSSDNAVSVIFGSFPLNADMLDGSFAAGIMPIFFSSTPTHTRQSLLKDPELVKEAIRVVNCRLLHMEHMTMEEAIKHLKAKKGRVAKGVPAFPMPVASRKRGRPTNQGLSGSGT